MAAPSRGRTRRTKNEINMVPFIDVMLVLLIIFMVTAPLITPSQIEVPSVGQAAKGQPPKFVHVIIEKDESIEVREGPSGGEGRSIRMNQLAQQVQLVQGRLGNAEGPAPVMISADKGIQYDTVVKAMDTLRNAGVERIGLSVKPSR